MEEKRNKDRQERDKRIWNSIGTMEEVHNKFLKDLPKLFQAQTEQLIKVLERTT